MATNPHFKLTTRHEALDAIAASVGTTCAFVLYDGTQPTDVSTTLGAQTSVARLVCTSGFATAAASAIAANTITDDSSAVGGSANWFTIEDSGGNRMIDGEVGTSGADLNLNSQTITAGATVSITSFTVTFAA